MPLPANLGYRKLPHVVLAESAANTPDTFRPDDFSDTGKSTSDENDDNMDIIDESSSVSSTSLLSTEEE